MRTLICPYKVTRGVSSRPISNDLTGSGACDWVADRVDARVPDGTLIPVDRLAERRPYYSGKYRQR
ncbi:hypothetical protein [Sinosporangium siamense]|uniref:Uncharacterized protein n=1 Tax=Sinosporangium siamense TaxID=1367973 RepID=A0A919REX4_9ACTN|nr:hypothetical protein [Sinosporangium siamense]GII92452.1 hypothetical protein Ssi02_26830 [Sinosporangium siamense]